MARPFPIREVPRQLVAVLALAAAAQLATALASAAASAASAAPQPPRLIMSILVDDLGFNDLGFTDSGVRTPNLDRLRAEGVLLSSLYVQPICTPTRSAFLTSRLPLALGLQGKMTVQQGQAWGLDVDEQTFVSALVARNWSTHMVGKAHIGGDRWRRSPTFRGFSSFMGYLYGAEDYYSHMLGAGLDLRNDTAPQCGPGCSQTIGRANNGTYSPYIFASEVERLVARAGADPGRRSTYIHFTPQSVHAPNEAPAHFVQPYVGKFGPNNTVRAIHAGALAALDEAIGHISAAIAAAGLADETLILLSADNGGPLGPVGDGTMASNYPLRGGKHSLFQGGVLATAFAWGPTWLGTGAGRTWAGLAHVVDLGATILDAAGVPPLPPLPGRPVHGVSFWPQLVAGAPASAREDVVVNIDYTEPSQAAIVRADGWKLLLGSAGGAPDCACTYWSAQRTGLPESPQPGGAGAGAGSGADKGALGGPSDEGAAPPSLWPLSNMTAMLYNLANDPRELHDLAAANPTIVAALTARLAAWGAGAVPVVENATIDPASDPRRFNGSWTPWLGM